MIEGNPVWNVKLKGGLTGGVKIPEREAKEDIKSLKEAVRELQDKIEKILDYLGVEL